MSKIHTLSNFKDLILLLQQDKVPYRLVDGWEESRVELPTDFGDLRSQLLLIWEPGSSIFQCIHPLPFEIPQHRMSAIESAIARINHALVLPGFGCNHQTHIIYYRLSIPCSEGATLAATAVQKICQTAIKTAANFYHPLQNIALHDQPAEDVLAQAVTPHNGA